MKKITLIGLIGLLNFQLQAQWTYLESAGTGVHGTDNFQAATEDLLVVADDEVYTTAWYTDAFAGNKRIEVRKFNGSTWSQLPSPETGGDIGGIHLRKASGSNDLYIAYAKLNSTIYEINVAVYNGTAWSSVGTTLPLPAGSSFFSFELDNDDVPIVLGSTASIVSDVNVHRLESGSWTAYPLPNSGGAVFNYNTSFVDNLNNVVFLWSKTAFVSGNLVQQFHIDTLNGTTLSATPENVEVPFGSSTFLVENGTDFSVYNSNSGGIGITDFQVFEYSSGSWTSSSVVSLDAYGISPVGKAPDGTNFVGQNKADGSKLYMVSELNAPVYVPSVSTGIFKLKFTADYAYCYVNNGVVRNSLPLEASVGIELLANDSFSVFPNPAEDNVTIHGLSTESVIVITDLTGKEVYKNNASNTQETIAVSHLSNGVYIVTVTQNGQSSTQKLVKGK